MPTLIEYPIVLERMRQHRMRCQYYNSGAFGFDAEVPMHFVGWIGPDDPSIRPAAAARARKIAPPYEATLAHLTTRAWQTLLPGPAWIMPRSNWAYELDTGSKTWMPTALAEVGIDAAILHGRTDSPAIEFLPEEADRFAPLVTTLLVNLLGSDFAIAFAEHPIACTVHHHKQIWWISSDEGMVKQLEAYNLGG